MKRILLLLLLSNAPAIAQQVGQPLPVWREGYLDIHQINTGRGNAALLILPDGTTALIDAGQLDPTDPRTQSPRNTPAKPNGERQAGEWIARYARKALSFRNDPAIDYAIMTHFHDDHMGTPSSVSKKAPAGDYVLTGVTEVGEFIPIRKVIDRGWPDYNYPRSFEQDPLVQNYRKFLTWQVQNKGLTVERFQAGRNDQIQLLKQPAKYKDRFEIRNLAVNGEIWTGVGSVTRQHFPELKSLPPNQYPNENMCSMALRLSYGKFDYFSGGDIPGVLQFGAPMWHDVETPVARSVGPVEVQLLDHHGNRDSQNGFLLGSLRPRVLVIPVWSSDHPGHDVLARIYSQQVYPGERDVFATHMLEANKLVIGELLNRLKSDSGHVLVRVDPGGDTYRVIILEDNDESFRVKAVHGPYQSR
ncbi:ComEC/Rec2 family competence protein [Larkinella sp. VNQ87]|uniref:ComEC/Rec2 family competence protein n=1 Tax=Larkinella sp. VNQ87 TaxID=3400921 RepID=UPI003C121207